jgi:hypothetical protein
MKAVKFPEMNIEIAKNQEEYLTLPAYIEKHPEGNGEVISCYQLTWKERIKVLFTGKIWWTQLTFGKPLQPQRASVDKWDTLNKEYFKSTR